MTFWVLTLVGGVLVLYVLREILLPFVAGMVIAYLLDPLTERLIRAGMSRKLAALLIVGMFAVSAIVLLLLIVPILASQLSALVTNFPDYVTRLQALLIAADWPGLGPLLGGDASKTMNDLVSQGAGWVATFVRSLWSGGRALVSVFSLAIVTPVIAFYLICDWPRMLATVEGWIPVAHRATVHTLAREIDAAIAGFLRGQSGVCLLVGSYYALALLFAGLNFGVLIGMISGLLTFIPYIGSMTGLVLSLAVAVAQFSPDWMRIMVVLAIFVVGQFLEGYIIAPKLVGESVGLHPVWLMFALFAFGYLFGFVGLLIAIPLAATIGVVLRFALRKYLESPIYTGRSSDLGPP
jgi:predicted PurR-regulated permease PerM